MKEKLLKIIYDHFPDFNNNNNNWQNVLDNCSIVPSFLYLQSMIEYYVSYYDKNDAINLSFVLYNNKEPVGVMPLIVSKNDKQEWVLSSNETEIIEPLFRKSLAPKVKKRLEKELQYLILDITKQLDIRKCQFVNVNLLNVSNWYLMWAKMAKEVFSTHHIFVNLSLSLQDIHLKFRKSFKPLVNKGLREWKVEVHEKVSNELFDSFRLFHKSEAGRVTRSNESWQIQKKQINSGESFLVLVKSKEDSLVGGGLFTYSRDKGFYSVGVYKRELNNTPLGHIVQMKAIETLKKNNVLWYEIGQKYLEIDRRKPNKKELLISHFMEGFASDIIARQNLIVNLSHDKSIDNQLI